MKCATLLFNYVLNHKYSKRVSLIMSLSLANLLFHQCGALWKCHQKLFLKKSVKYT